MREFDVRAGGKHRVSRKCRAESIESIGLRQWPEDHTLRVSDSEDRRGQRLAQDRNLSLPDIRWMTKRCPERVALRLHSLQVERFLPGSGVNGHRRSNAQLLALRDQCGQTSQSVPRQLRRTAVRIQQSHRCAAIAQFEQDQAIAAHTTMAIADRASKDGQLALGFVRRDEQKFVAVRVGFRDAQVRHQGTLKASKTYVKPAAAPTPASMFVIPSMTAASARQLPTVYLPPKRNIPRDSVPGGG